MYDMYLPTAILLVANHSLLYFCCKPPHHYAYQVQHDQQVVRSFDLRGALAAMRAHPAAIRYVGLCSLSTLGYSAKCHSKFGVAVAPFAAPRARFGVPLLPLIFWYDKPHIVAARYYREAILPTTTLTTHEVVRLAVEGQGGGGVGVGVGARREPRGGNGNGNGNHGPAGLPSSSFAVGRYDFIEETYGKAQRADIVAHGMAAHAKYGTWQLQDACCEEEEEEDEDEADGTGSSRRDGKGRVDRRVVVMHVHGRTFLTAEQRVARGWPAEARSHVASIGTDVDSQLRAMALFPKE